MENKFTLSLDINQVNAIFAALSEQPYKTAAPLIAALDEQLKPQIQQAQQDQGPLSNKLI